MNASCDILHPGLIARLEKAKAAGDFLYVGIQDDDMIKYYRGSRFPLQTTQERCLMALSLDVVDDIVIGAPYIITGDLMKSLNIHTVVNVLTDDDKVLNKYQDIDAYAVPKQQGKYQEIERDPEELTVMKLAERVREN